MKIVKTLVVLLFLLILIGVSCIFYAFKIEPYKIETNEYTLNEKKNNASELKIVQFSDLHIKEDFTHENLDKIISEINEQNPDIVFFTGDLYDNYAKYNDNQNIISKLNNIEAKYGKFAIWGNRDYGGGAVRQYAEIMANAGFTLLRNENHYLSVHNKNILISGIDDLLLGNPTLPTIRDDVQTDYKILLTHEPDIIENYSDYNYDLMLSGHSHGGQINVSFLPFINKKALSITDFSSKYSGGIYQIKEGYNTKLYVNTGIGTTHISARFGVTPEIALFHIYI